VTIDVKKFASALPAMITTLVGYALLVLIGAAVLGEFGVRASFLPRVSGQSLTWLAAAWWLYRGGKI
jgi:hypothetical protein